MSRRATFIGTGAIVLVVIAIGASMYMLRAGARWPFSPGLQSTVKVVCPGPTYTVNGDGVPLIRPRNDCTPSFTEQDVRDYVSHHGAPLFKIEVVGKPTITTIVFTTIRDLGQASGDSEFAANYPADMGVCVVDLKGTFSVDSPLGGTVQPVTSAFFLLDAHTGNLLMAGTGTPVK